MILLRRTDYENRRRTNRFFASALFTTPSKWREKAEWRRANRDWLPYSRKIAIQTAMALEEKEMSQRQLAESMGCSPQYVSRLLKGEENLSLETICKLENTLQEPIMQAVFA